MVNFPYWIVLDIETQRSANDCLYCGKEPDAHIPNPSQLRCGNSVNNPERCYAPIGWENKPALGLSIGCFWDSRDGRTYFFDEMNLQDAMQQWVDEQPLIVTFNGLQFDLPLIRGILRRRAETIGRGDAIMLRTMCDAFKMLCYVSYDILAEIWQISPESKRVKGINKLGALAMANGYGGKTGDGAQAPRDWAVGKHAQVINYCAHDVYLTKALFDQIQRGEPIRRHDGTGLFLPKDGCVT